MARLWPAFGYVGTLAAATIVHTKIRKIVTWQHMWVLWAVAFYTIPHGLQAHGQSE